MSFLFDLGAVLVRVLRSPVRVGARNPLRSTHCVTARDCELVTASS